MYLWADYRPRQQRICSLQRPSIKLLHRYYFEVQSVQTTNIDRCYRSTLRVNPFGVRMNTARWAKPMPDYVFVKLISADVFIRRLDRQLLARDEPQ